MSNIDTTSSIGATWPPQPAPFERIRGFYGDYVDTTAKAEDLVVEFDSYKKLTMDNVSVDRLSVRALITKGVIPAVESAGVEIEGALPIRGNDNDMVAYLGWNAPQRTLSGVKSASESTLIDTIANTPRAVDYGLQVDQGLKLGLVDSSMSSTEREALVDKFTELYAVFGYDQAEVSSLVTNSHNIIAYLEDEVGVVSTALAEKAQLYLNGYGFITLVEITEAATRPSARGKGYYRKISGFLTGLLLDMEREHQDHFDVIYGESNLAMKGVLIAAHQNGRQFSHADRHRLGVTNPSFGILPQNFHVRDGVETRPYNDFALSYIPDRPIL